MPHNPASLGPKRFDVTPDWLNIFAGVVISLLVMVGGIVAVVAMIRQLAEATPDDDLFFPSVFALLGVAIVGVAVYLLWMILRQRSIQADVHQSGFHCRTRDASDVVLWQDIAAIHETVASLRPRGRGLIKYAIPDEPQTTALVITTREGKTFEFKPGLMRNSLRFRLALRGASRDHSIPWELEDRSKRT